MSGVLGIFFALIACPLIFLDGFTSPGTTFSLFSD